jgi:hypothetical protein
VGRDLGEKLQGIEHPEVGAVTGVDRLPRVEDLARRRVPPDPVQDDGLPFP